MPFTDNGGTAAITPMMQQYLDVKEKHKDCILFFRLGDFYEMFFDDAVTASRELEITLTGRNCGLAERAPMCGVPYHAADSYISKLINKGYKVAICEQVEDPAFAKGLVKRDIIRVVTPGTVIESSMLDEKKNNYLMCIYKSRFYFGIAVLDISTGEFSSAQICKGNTITRLIDEIAKFAPSELLVNKSLCSDDSLLSEIKRRYDIYITEFDDAYFEYAYASNKIKKYFKKSEILNGDTGLAANASGAMLEYLEQTHKADFSHIREIKYYKSDEFMIIDSSTRRNLELTESMRDRQKKGSLLWVLDSTVTPMGGRMLRKWVEQPLLDPDEINSRLDGVSEFKDKFIIRSETRESLNRVYDVERLIARIVTGNSNCRDFISLKLSIGKIPFIKSVMKDCRTGIIRKNHLLMDELKDIYELIDTSIVDEPPIALMDGGIIKDGYDPDIDRCRKAANEGKNWLASLENSEREKTGIKNLKISYNKIFGYYIEVTKSYFPLVPSNYIRRQTLANCERYIMQELKEMEDEIIGAEEKLKDLEYAAFMKIKDSVAGEVSRIKDTACAIAEIDVLSSLAEKADREDWCRPAINDGDIVQIAAGRHPVVERVIGPGAFVHNDTYLDMAENRLNIITGPNMAGKSTYIRQVALIVLMSQIGSFVPAKSAEIGVADRIFTRVGASDDLASGQSTFMVEMSEVAAILKNATHRSLLILDEIGRGTSTYDGLSIAWAVIEYICDAEKLGARTLFATHYHELTELEGKITGIKNYFISAEEKGDDIIFLRKIIRGGADDSYGIQVARLAGLPSQVLDRAGDILKALEEADISKKELRARKSRIPLDGQLDLFTVAGYVKSREELIDEIKNLNIQEMTPIDAINTLFRLQQKAKRDH